MNSFQIEKQITRCSPAIRLIDAYTGKQPHTSGLQFTLDNVIQPPIIKTDGYVIYTNLPEGEYTCRIQSDYYLPIHKTVIVDHAEPKLNLSLTPSSAYPFAQQATYIRLAVQDNKGKKLNGALITSTCVSEESIRAVIAQDAHVDDISIFLTQIKGKIGAGDIFLLSNRGNDNGDDEYCCISEEIDGFRNFKLEHPLLSDYQRGTMLKSTWKSQTDVTGEAVIPFRYPLSKSFVVQIKVEWEDFIMVREVDVKEAQSTYIGMIQLA